MTAFGFSDSGQEDRLRDPGDLGDLGQMEYEGSTALRTLTWASLAVAVAAAGLYIGRELRVRYKFRRRTPYDFFSKAGARASADYTSTEYGMGV